MIETSERDLNLLIVDDDVTLALSLQDLLEEEGYRVAVANSGSEAIALGSNNRFELALIDLKLPDRSGVDLVRELTRKNAETEYIILTGYASVDTAVKAVAEKRIIAYETKPVDMERFLALIRQVMERRRAERTLRKKEWQLRFLLERTPCILWTTDADLRYTSSTGAGLASLGQRPDEIVGRTVFEIIGANDPDVISIRAHQRALSGVPVSYEVERTGRTFFCHVEPLHDEQDNITGVMGLALDITERKRAEEELRSLSHRLVEIQEDERRSIARELHDQTGQLLTALKIMLDRLAHLSWEKAAFPLAEAQALVGELMNQIRNMSLDLRPAMLDDLGLLPALLWQFERYTNRTGIRLDFRHSGMGIQLSPTLSTAAYRIVQEALTNVARHSGVKEAAVHAWTDLDRLCLRIEDRGGGFDMDSLPEGMSSGISGMRERARLLGGSLAVESVPGMGTCVTAELPLSTDNRTEGGKANADDSTSR